MAAKYILAAGAVIFLGLATRRLARDRGRMAPASRTWLITGMIFTGVSTYLWMVG